MSYTKIVVTAPKVKFPAGAKLGLDTKLETAFAAFVKRTAPGYFDVMTPINFPKGAVLYVDNPDKYLAKYKNDRGDEVSSFEVIDMPVGYREEKPADVAKREAVLKPKPAPVKDAKKAS